MVNKINIMYLILAWVLPLPAQELDIESLFDGDFEVEEESSVIEELYELLENPLDINKADFYELQKIPWISSFAAQELVDYRQKHRIRNLSELQKLEGFEQHYYIIRRFLIVDKKNDTFTVKSRHRMVHKINGEYQDIDSNFYNRIRMQVNRFDGGLLVEKDAGERHYADFITGFLEYRHQRLPIKITLGQFNAKSARGLVLWSPYGLRKSSDVLAPIKHRGQGIRPYSSTDENAAFSGAAIEYQSPKFHTFVFASHHQIDANVTNNMITSFPSTGYHRSAAEIERKNATIEKAAGTRLQYRSESLDLGVTAFTNQFSFPLAGNLAEQKPGITTGIDYDYRSSFCNFFGETAYTNNAWANIHGLHFNYNNFSSVLQWRSFAADFHQTHAFAFASDKTNNEHGVYLGAQFTDDYFSFSLFVDQFQNPAETIDDLQPGEAFDLLGLLKYHFNEKADITFRYKKRERWENDKLVDEFGNEKIQSIHNLTHIMRLQLDLQASHTIFLRTRAEFSFQDHSPACGNSLYQHICYNAGKMKMHCRWTLFDVPDYTLRLYQYENDMPGMMNNRLLYGRGSRFFLLLVQHFDCFTVNTKFSTITLTQNPTKKDSGFSKEKQYSIQIDWNIN